MKFSLVLFSLLFLPFLAIAQDYRGENKVFLKFEKKDKSYYTYESDKLTIEINRELNLFFFDVDLDTFKSLDSISGANFWDGFFKKEFHNDVLYKGDIPLMALDVQSDRKQRIEVDGILHIGEAKLELPLILEWIQMDRFVFVDFNYKVKMKEIGINIPEKYQKELTGNLYIQVLNGKLMGGFR